DRATDTPGSTAPEESEMVPPIAPTPCAIAGSAEPIHNDNTAMLLTKSLAVIVTPLFDRRSNGREVRRRLPDGDPFGPGQGGNVNNSRNSADDRPVRPACQAPNGSEGLVARKPR